MLGPRGTRTLLVRRYLSVASVQSFSFRLAEACIQRFPARKSILSGVPVADLFLAQLPAEQHRFAVQDARKIQQAFLQVLHLHANFIDLGQRVPRLLERFLARSASLRRLSDVDMHSA